MVTSPMERDGRGGPGRGIENVIVQITLTGHGIGNAVVVWYRS
jgi:hypothetical protein